MPGYVTYVANGTNIIQIMPLANWTQADHK